MPDSYPCGPDGFVRLVDHMGTDAAIVQAARVSYGDGTKHVTNDRDLIRYLMRHYHTTPFEMVQLKFHIRVPMSVWRQWVRHRTGSINEYSTRYSISIDSTASSRANEWRLQSKSNKQGSEGVLGPMAGHLLTVAQKAYHTLSRSFYLLKLRLGVSRELARDDLPLGTYTEAYWSVNLHNLFHFLALRLDQHAQQEIREFAMAIECIVADIVPVAMRAFRDYRVGSMTLSYYEIETLSGRCKEVLKGRELKEFNTKKERLGL